MSRDEAANIRARVLARCVAEPSGCVVWNGAKIGDGYGLIAVGGATWLVHRVMYTIDVGEPGPCLDHLCRNRACVNPAHLERVSQKVNVRRGVAARAA